MTLYRKLKNEIENHRGFWNYYDVNFDDVLKNEGNARNFIYNYFKGGSKIYALDTWANSMNEYTQMRNVHTVNVFFIGAFLQRMIDENIAIKSKVSSDYPFSYIWYLTCLAHDLGYVYEKYSKAYLELSEKKYYRQYEYSALRNVRFMPRKIWYQKHGIDITYMVPAFGSKSKIAYYSQKVGDKQNGNIEYNNGTLIKSTRYSREIVNNYFYYRLYDMHVLDHGIVGADEFFSRLIINYVREYRVMASKEFFRENFSEFHNEQGLHFCSEQFKIFAYIADCIASHNMYKADNRSQSKYMDYSLNCMLLNTFKSISYKDNPLLLVLCIADTIEPSKRFLNYRNMDVLNLVSIDYNVDTNFLCVEIDEEMYNSEAGQKYASDIEGLMDWCDIKTVVVPKKLKRYTLDTISG